MAGFDLRKKLGLFNAERQVREELKSVEQFTSLLGISPEQLTTDLIVSKLSQVMTKSDAAKIAAILQRYANS